MFELTESTKKEITINEGMLKNATYKITEFHKIAKNAVLGIALILSDIADKPKEYLESSGFNTIAEYTEAVFGYKKSYTYKLIRISKFISIKSINGENLSVSDLIEDKINVDYSFETIADADGFEYSPSQMLELIPLTKQQIEDKIEGDYNFETIADADGFEYSPSQMLELISLTEEQLKENIKELDSSLTCKELRSIVKDIVNPPIEVKGESSEENKEDNKEDNKEEDKQEETPLTDKEKIMQMLEVCATLENEDIKSKIVNVFQKSLKALEK